MLSLKEISKVYKIKKGSDVQALDKISYDFNSTGMYFILGKSGCGKSTLLNILGGLDTQTEGDILVDGQALVHLKPKDLDDYRNSNVGFIFQDFNLLPSLSVKENVALALKLQGIKITDEIILNVLEKVDIAELLNRRINELSGGQKQRVAIARALIKNPKIILADEPTGALDSENSTQILDLLKLLSKEYLVIVVSHDWEFATQYADEIIHLRDGLITNIEKLNSIEDIEKTESIVEKKTKSLPILTALKLGFSNLNIKVFRLIITILLTVASLICLGVAFTAFSYDKEEFVYNSIEENGYRDPLAIGTYNKNRNFSRFDFGTLDVKEVSKALDIEFLGLCGETTYKGTNFMNANNYTEGYNDKLALEKLNGYVISDESIIEKNNYTMVGTYPIKDNEIAITNWMYESFKKFGYKNEDGVTIPPAEVTKNALIGNTIKMSNISFLDIFYNYKITGIIDTKLNLDEYRLLEEYYNYQLNYQNSIEQRNEAYLIDTYKESSIHSVGFVRKEIGMNTNIRENSGYDFLISPSSYDTDTIKKINSYLSTFGDEDKVYALNLSNRYWIERADSNLNVYKNVAFTCGMVLLVFSSLLLFSLINMSVSAKENEMGILKALGAKAKDIFMIFSAEGIIIAIFNIVLATIGTFIFVDMLNKDIKSSSGIIFTAYNFEFIHFLGIFGVCLLATFISIFIPVFRVSKRKPIESIRKIV